MFRFLACVAAAVFMTPAVASASYADGFEGNQISVSAVGKIQVRPDLMRLHAGVEVVSPSASEAYSSLRSASSELISSLASAGVDAADVKTRDLSLHPQYVPDRHPEIAGYRGTQGVEVIVRELDGADRVLGAIQAAGSALRVHSVSFEVSDPEAAQREARASALAKARAKAEEYAAVAGRELGALISFTDSAPSYRPPVVPFAMSMAMADGSAGAKSLPVSPGEETLEARVSVVYEARTPIPS